VSVHSFSPSHELGSLGPRRSELLSPPPLRVPRAMEALPSRVPRPASCSAPGRKAPGLCEWGRSRGRTCACGSGPRWWAQVAGSQDLQLARPGEAAGTQLERDHRLAPRPPRQPGTGPWPWAPVSPGKVTPGIARARTAAEQGIERRSPLSRPAAQGRSGTWPEGVCLQQGPSGSARRRASWCWPKAGGADCGLAWQRVCRSCGDCPSYLSVTTVSASHSREKKNKEKNPNAFL